MKIGNRKRLTGAALIFSLLLTGCQKGDNSIEDKGSESRTLVETEKLAQNIHEKYADSETIAYGEAIRGIKRDEHIKLQMGFDIMNAGFDEYTQLAAVYQDAGLTQRIGTNFEWDEESKVLSITPPRSGAGGISNAELDSGTPGNNPADYKLFDKGEYKDWGNLSQYYLVQYVDFEDGTVLDKPIVTVFTVERELESAPNVSMRIDEDGLPVFGWKEVDGADTYYIMEMDYSQDRGFVGNGWVQGVTQENSWKPEKATHLKTFSVSEAERAEEYNIEKYGEGTEPIYNKENPYETYYCVIAASEDGTSAISNTFSEMEIARRVPYMEETGVSREKEGSDYAEGFAGMPSYKWITMCDGTLVQKLINYDFDGAQYEIEKRGEYEEEDMSDLRIVEVEVVRVPYVIDGTGFTGVVKVENFDADTWEEGLKEIQERQEKLRNRGGARELEIEIQEEDENQEKKNDEVYENEYKITANSALSEYLAANMLSGASLIDLQDFPESGDQEFLVDAWMEAVYQNPMILGAQGASLLNNGKTMLVQYDTDAAEMLKKQEELAKEVKRVVSEIITDDMTELEKELAINQYLCDSAEYDMDALENAKKYDYADVDEEFDDSFTPYGVLMNKAGVCASYAGAFKLLADEADLECIVVTGVLEGNLPHAWNKVKVDGEWQIVDSTNNDNELIFNALLNLPDHAAGKVLVEDDKFVLDSKLSDYEASTDEKEYYRLQDKFYEQEEIVSPLLEALEDADEAVLRTDYNLNDRQFDKIARKVLEQYNEDGLYGYYWMGVIYLTKE